MKLYQFIDEAIQQKIGLTTYKNYYFDETSSDALVDIIEVVKQSSIGELELTELDDSSPYEDEDEED